MQRWSHLPDFHPETLRPQPLPRAETIPSSWYTDPALLELEREAVFCRSWQYAGWLGRLLQPGRLILTEVAQNPILVVRDEQGQLRAFYNVCRHRGGPLALQEGRVRMLQCQYHGWTYRLDGSLRGVPRFRYAELFDQRDYGLHPLFADSWENLVFVHLERPQRSLEQVLEGIRERVAPQSLGDFRFHRRISYQVQCNWKVYVDNYLEGYHLPFVHPELCTHLDYSDYRTETFRYYSLQSSPIRSGEGPYGGPGEALYYFVFPNFMLNILPGRLQTNLVLPLAVDQTEVIFDYYYLETEGTRAQARIAEDQEYSDKIQREDMEICRHVQKGLLSRGYDRGRFSVECEAGVHHFQELLKAAFRRHFDLEG